MRYRISTFAILPLFVLLVLIQGASVAEAAGSESRSSTDKVLMKEAEKFKKSLPTKLGSYTTLPSWLASSPVDIQIDCEDIGQDSDAKLIGLKGEVCMKTTRFAYTDSKNKRMVIVSLIKVSSGKAVFTKYINQIMEHDTLDRYAIFHTEDEEFGWWTKGPYDIVLISGRTTDVALEETSSTLKVEESSKNPVTSYLLKKYKPIKVKK